MFSAIRCALILALIALPFLAARAASCDAPDPKATIAAPAGNAQQSWGVKADKGDAAAQFGMSREQLSAAEAPLEISVSRYIRTLPFLWFGIDDEPGPMSDRGFIERNSIALLSNYQKPAIDRHSAAWLGQYSDRPKVRSSGLWNNNHVDENYQQDFLTKFAALISYSINR